MSGSVEQIERQNPQQSSTDQQQKASSLYQRSNSIAEREQAYARTANQLTGYLFSEVTEFSNKPGAGKWKYEGKRRGVSIYKSQSEFQSKNPCLLGHIKMSCDPGYLSSYIRNSQTRFYYDNSLKGLVLLQKVSNDISVYHSSFQTKRCVINYGVNVCNIVAIRNEGDTFITGYSSVPPHPKMVLEKTIPTLWLHYSGFVVKAGIDADGNPCSDVFYLFQFDYKEDLSSFIVNFAMDRQMAQLAYIKLTIEKCLLSPQFSDSGESMTTVQLSRRNSNTSSSSRHLLKVPSTSSLTTGCGRLNRMNSSTSLRSAVVSGGSSSPPLSMRSVSDPGLGTSPSKFVPSNCSSDDDESHISQSESFESLMQSVDLLSESGMRRISDLSYNSSFNGTPGSKRDYADIAVKAGTGLFREYIDIVESVRSSADQPSDISWKLIAEKRGMWVMENTESNSNWMHVCGVTRVDTDCNTLVDYLCDLEKRMEYDRFLHKTHVVEELGPDLRIAHLHFKAKHCLGVQYERDACIVSHVTRKDNKALLVTASVEHEQCPTQKNTTRATIRDSGFIVEGLPMRENQCSLVFVFKVHLGTGYFPYSLLWMIKRRYPLLLTRIADRFRVSDSISCG